MTRGRPKGKRERVLVTDPVGKRDPTTRAELDAVTHESAVAAAEQMIILRMPIQAIKDALIRQFSLTAARAAQILREADAAVRGVARGTIEDERRALVRSTELVFAKAFQQNQLTVCIGANRFIADVLNVTPAPSPFGRQQRPEGQAMLGPGEYAERSDADLEYFTEHGYWPEEAPDVLPASAESPARAAPASSSTTPAAPAPNALARRPFPV